MDGFKELEELEVGQTFTSLNNGIYLIESKGSKYINCTKPDENIAEFIGKKWLLSPHTLVKVLS